MNILMIHPEHPVTFWSYKHVLKCISKKSAYPPLGLLTVAAMLPKHWAVRLTDLNIENLREEHLAWADYVMVSAMMVQQESVREIMERCRRAGKKTIGGGPLFNGFPEEYARLVDHLILNEAEITLPPFLADLERGRPEKVYRSADFPPLSLTPLPRWDLIDIRKYATLLIQFSRGCPFNCDFCDVTATYGRKPRLKSKEQFLAELQALYDIGWRGNVFVVDDNFIGNEAAIKEMLPGVIDWMNQHDDPFSFITEASINMADDDELTSLMVEAGFDCVFIGLETPNEESLKECSKSQNCQRDMKAAVRKLQAAGLQVLGGYIVGFDHDDESIFSRQIRFIQESGVVTAMVGLLNAIPNTRLWRRLKEENRLDWVPTGNNTDGTINFIPRMDRAKLLEGYRKIVQTIYSPRCYYQRVSRFLADYQPRRRRKRNDVPIKAFLKSILYVGVMGNGASQWYYWRMLVKSLLFHRNAFAEAMTLMVFGNHFRKVAKKI
jgi:radical SAM superfamily enzyme YgiQ (UPF0313 family)